MVGWTTPDEDDEEEREDIAVELGGEVTVDGAGAPQWALTTVPFATLAPPSATTATWLTGSSLYIHTPLTTPTSTSSVYCAAVAFQ